MKKILIYICVVFLSISFLTTSKAQNYLGYNDTYAEILSERGQTYDAWSMSMGNAISTLGANYSATLFNPATLSLTDKVSFSTSIGLNLYRNTATYLGMETKSNKTETNLNQFGLVYPIKMDSSGRTFAFSLGYNHSKDFNKIIKFEAFNTDNSFISNLASINHNITRELLLSYPYNNPNGGGYLEERTILNNNLRQNASLINEGGINNWSAGASYEFAHNVFFGASINYAVGTILSNREVSETDVNDFYGQNTPTVPDSSFSTGFESFYLNDVVEWSYNGLDARFGLLYKFFNFISLGGSVKLPTKFNIQEDHYFNGNSNFSSGAIRELNIPVINSKYTITTPFEFTAAAAVNLFFITAAAEVSYTDYTQMRFSGDIDVTTTAALNKNILEKYRQVFNLRSGAEFRLPFTGLSARAGFMYNPSPFADATQADAKKILNAGLGISSGEGDLEFNVTYSRCWWEQVSEDFGTGSTPLNQSIKIDNIMASFTVRFN